MTGNNANISKRLMDEVLNARDYAVMDEIVAEDFVELDPLPGLGPGREGLRQVFKMLHQAFPDMHWETDEQISEGNKTVSRFHWTGTQAGEFAGSPPTGRAVRVRGVVIDEYENGMIVRSRILSDDLGMMQQLGLIPAGPS